MQEDPIGDRGGSLNWYSYVANNPVNYIDPLGLLSFLWHGNWCGSGWTAGKWKPESQLLKSEYSYPVRDPRDNCCRGHDICIKENPCDIRNCDHEYASCLRSIKPWEKGFWAQDTWHYLGLPIPAWFESLDFDTWIPYIIH